MHVSDSSIYCIEYRNFPRSSSKTHSMTKSHLVSKLFLDTHTFHPGVKLYIFHPGAKQENTIWCINFPKNVSEIMAICKR